MLGVGVPIRDWFVSPRDLTDLVHRNRPAKGLIGTVGGLHPTARISREVQAVRSLSLIRGQTTAAESRSSG